MRHDELWFLKEMDTADDLTRDEDELDEYFFSEADLVSQLVDDEALSDSDQRDSTRRFARRCRRPKRQLHPCCHTVWQRYRHDDHSEAVIRRQSRIDQVLARDLRDQLADYEAQQFTDIPSVGQSVAYRHFAAHLGEHPQVFVMAVALEHEVEPDTELEVMFFANESVHDEYHRVFSAG